MEEKLISFEIKADFGFLKKPDINEGIYLTYNCLHKPALLGILGAIIGLGGFYQSYIQKKTFPEYFDKLGKVKIGIQPLTVKGNFTKTVIKYNNSVGYASEEQGRNLIINEQTLIKPSFRIFLLLHLNNEDEKKLFEYIKNSECEFIPYLGKNDFQIWWDINNVKEYSFVEDNKVSVSRSIDNLFIKPAGKTIRQNTANQADEIFDWSQPITNDFFIFFERLPIGYDEQTSNYKYEDFVFTNKKLVPAFLNDTSNIFHLRDEDKSVQLN
ncbi:MAG: type I-B CRISPR-associated protein Cas5b [Ignavibacteria bacterium]|nr:type I-B CRISPR-associated protein Cas5b [Ignavibacteria bacterium]